VPVVEQVKSMLERYYQALEAGKPLDSFYATDEEAGELGPVVKVGSGPGELYVGSASVTAAVRHVTETLVENRLESRGPLQVRVSGDLALFADSVWWSGIADGKRFASLTRWTGVCLHTRDADNGWRFLQLHVSEEVA
jgi:hypothetical protein